MDFIDLKSQYGRLKQSIDEAIHRVLDHGQYIMGPEVGELESALSEFVGGARCITCSSGTEALLMALMAKGVGPGDAVFTSALTFIATAEVIALLGATPVFVDVDAGTCNMSPDSLQEKLGQVQKNAKISAGTPTNLVPKCVIAVDLYGLPADYLAINKIAADNGMFVIQDGAQSFGANVNGKQMGDLAEIGATSFFPAKPLGCYGDGGAIFTRDDELAEVLSSIRLHGKGSEKYDNVRIGLNGRLDTLQAAVLLAKLPVFAEEIRLRNAVATRYTESLKNRVKIQEVPSGATSAMAQYSFQTGDRDELQKHLVAKGIPTGVYYPKGLHLQIAFQYLGYETGSLPVTETISSQTLSLPMHPYLEEGEQENINRAIQSAL